MVSVIAFGLLVNACVRLHTLRTRARQHAPAAPRSVPALRTAPGGGLLHECRERVATRSGGGKGAYQQVSASDPSTPGEALT